MRNHLGFVGRWARAIFINKVVHHYIILDTSHNTFPCLSLSIPVSVMEQFWIWATLHWKALLSSTFPVCMEVPISGERPRSNAALTGWARKHLKSYSPLWSLMPRSSSSVSKVRMVAIVTAVEEAHGNWALCSCCCPKMLPSRNLQLPLFKSQNVWCFVAFCTM